MSKYIKDFKSQVTCLPGPVKNNDTKETGKLMSEKRFEKSDIFFSKKSGSVIPENTQKQKTIHKKNIQSNEMDIICRKKSSRPENIKNIFESQIFK